MSPEVRETASEAASTYGDRQIATTLRFGDSKHDYVTHFWHPDPLHPATAPALGWNFAKGPTHGATDT